jgi:uncharacterized protein
MNNNSSRPIIYKLACQLVIFLGCWCSNLSAHGMGSVDSTTLEMIIVSSKGDVQGIGELLRQGMSIESTDVIGNTPLIFASRYGRNDEVRFLLDRGADVNARSRTGGTPLREAVNKMDAVTIRLLLDAGAAVDVRDEDGESAIFYAVRHGFLPGLELLLEHGAYTNLVNNQGDTSLIYAVKQAVPSSADQWARIIKSLIMYGADPDIKNKDNETALCIARRLGKSKIARLLLNTGASDDGCHTIAGNFIGVAAY